LALKISLKVMASAVLRLRQPLVFTVPWRTVAKVLSMGLVMKADRMGLELGRIRQVGVGDPVF
jgi:hypothetical protein